MGITAAVEVLICSRRITDRRCRRAAPRDSARPRGGREMDTKSYWAEWVFHQGFEYGKALPNSALRNLQLHVTRESVLPIASTLLNISPNLPLGCVYPGACTHRLPPASGHPKAIIDYTQDCGNPSQIPYNV